MIPRLLIRRLCLSGLFLKRLGKCQSSLTFVGVVAIRIFHSVTQFGISVVEWRMKVNTFQVDKAYRVNVDLPRRPTPALTNQIRYIGVLHQP